VVLSLLRHCQQLLQLLRLLQHQLRSRQRLHQRLQRSKHIMSKAALPVPVAAESASHNRTSSKHTSRKRARASSSSCSTAHLDVIVSDCLAMLRQRAMLAAAASVLPVPGLSAAVDVALMARLMEDINHAFGLSAHQLRLLPQSRRALVYNAIGASGNLVIGKLVTSAVALNAFKLVGASAVAKQFARFVPVAGQIAGATLGYWLTCKLGQQHIDDCLRLARQLQLGIGANDDEPQDVAFTEVV
jgi:uncharacterized protein (DUF697 family)